MGTTGGRRVELTSAGGVVSRRLEGDDRLRLFVDAWGMPEEIVQRLPPDTPTPPPWCPAPHGALPKHHGAGAMVSLCHQESRDERYTHNQHALALGR